MFNALACERVGVLKVSTRKLANAPTEGVGK